MSITWNLFKMQIFSPASYLLNQKLWQWRPVFFLHFKEPSGWFWDKVRSASQWFSETVSWLTSHSDVLPAKEYLIFQGSLSQSENIAVAVVAQMFSWVRSTSKLFLKRETILYVNFIKMYLSCRLNVYSQKLKLTIIYTKLFRDKNKRQILCSMGL